MSILYIDEVNQLQLQLLDVHYRSHLLREHRKERTHAGKVYSYLGKTIAERGALWQMGQMVKAIVSTLFVFTFIPLCFSDYRKFLKYNWKQAVAGHEKFKVYALKTLSNHFTYRGNLSNEQGELEEALNHFHLALQCDPDAADTLERQTTLVHLKRHLEQDLIDVERELQQNSHAISALCRRTEIYIQQGRLDEALADLEQVMVLEPNLPHAMRLRGIIYYKQKRLMDAFHDLNQAMRLESYSVEALCYRAEIYWRHVFDRVSQPQLDCALQDFNHALELDPHSILALSSRGLFLLKQDRLEEALRDFNLAIEMDAYAVNALEYRGDLHVQQGNLEEALVDYNRVLGIMQDFTTEVYYKRERILWELEEKAMQERHQHRLPVFGQPYEGAF